MLRLSGNATITDHRPSKTRVALGLEGDKQPAVPSQCIDPSHNLHYWERKYCQLPTNKHLPISREGIAFFFQPWKENKVFLRPAEKEWEEKIRRRSPLSSFLRLSSLFFFFFLDSVSLASPSLALLSLSGHWVLPCHSSDSSPHNSNGAEILFVIRYGNSAVISQMMPLQCRPNNSQTDRAVDGGDTTATAYCRIRPNVFQMKPQPFTTTT